MTSSAQYRKDPQKGKKEFSKQKGFTVIELLIAVAVIAIITSLALPSYRTIIEKRQVTSGAQQIAAFLSAAQLEAVKRNQNVSIAFTYTDGADWCLGMTVSADGCTCSAVPATNTCEVDGAERVLVPANLNYPEALTVIDGNDDGYIVFDPVRGMLTDFTDVLSLELLSQPENTYALNVDIGPTGRVRICSDSADTQVPGFDPCL